MKAADDETGGYSWLRRRSIVVWQLVQSAPHKAAWQHTAGLPIEPGDGAVDFAQITQSSTPKKKTLQRGTSFFPPDDRVLLYVMRLYINQQTSAGVSEHDGCPPELLSLLRGATKSQGAHHRRVGCEPVVSMGCLHSMWAAVAWFQTTFPKWCAYFRGADWRAPHPSCHSGAQDMTKTHKRKQPPARTGGGRLLALYMDVAGCGALFESKGLAMYSAFLNVLGALTLGGRFPLLTGAAPGAAPAPAPHPAPAPRAPPAWICACACTCACACARTRQRPGTYAPPCNTCRCELSAGARYRGSRPAVRSRVVGGVRGAAW